MVQVGEVESWPVCDAGQVKVKVQEAPALLCWIRERSNFREWGSQARSNGRWKSCNMYTVGATGCPP